MKSYTTILGVIESRANGLGYRLIAGRYGIGNSTICLIEERFGKLGISLEEFKKLPELEAIEAIYQSNQKRRKDTPLPDFGAIHTKITNSKGKWNLMAEWFDYIEENPFGYKLSQFYEYYNRYVSEHFGLNSVKMAVERKPGEKMYIDWAGDQPQVLYVDGKLAKIHLFVTTVGVSSKIYAQAFTNEKIDKFIRGVVNALASYDACARIWVPDNLKTAVTKHDNDCLLLNTLFHDLESFYDVVVLPPPARKPKGKPTVESAVKYAETHILEKIKHKTYTSIQNVNEDVFALVNKMNERTEKRAFSRNQLFEEYDKPCMKKLSGQFSLSDYKFFSKVPNNYHLEYDNHYYSVSYLYYGKPAILQATFSEITIIDENHKVIAKHKRVYTTYPLYITEKEHMPSAHKFYVEVNERDGKFYRNWSKKFGLAMYQFIDLLLRKADHEEQAYKSCNGILHTAESYSYTRINDVARFCIEHNLVYYSGFMKALNNKAINVSTAESKALPEHSNIRGPQEYR